MSWSGAAKDQGEPRSSVEDTASVGSAGRAMRRACPEMRCRLIDGCDRVERAWTTPQLDCVGLLRRFLSSPDGTMLSRSKGAKRIKELESAQANGDTMMAPLSSPARTLRSHFCQGQVHIGPNPAAAVPSPGSRLPVLARVLLPLPSPSSIAPQQHPAPRRHHDPRTQSGRTACGPVGPGRKADVLQVSDGTGIGA